MTNVVVLVGAGSIGQAIARRVSAGKHVLLADLHQENADAAANLMLFWTRPDLESKLRDFQDYYNRHRAHSALSGRTPQETSGSKVPLSLGFYRWRRHCGGLYQTPIAA